MGTMGTMGTREIPYPIISSVRREDYSLLVSVDFS